ncbi:type II toxin-antitoxin system VapC family toxin [Desulfoscipio gibsoniae]|uniref:Putative nucleic acid-binding protein, contains PIN domain n=1 Tax=Desulfoscipio gibsoniae DSM 7213 TaxID=767817 RepID=G6I789_9FIRM|nr:type II toxin-antitoxin system VapC family toxin [Desulfoscipio gibsoniae]AGK99799.1 putative nucleic acid-binding protein, contains PIN domain [Desulfoscipio gibsoniae DSM 7213]AGK99809.1 putative nucleic acid-binding protein, contains PIN domain [Desulfoscipio gibsoniae DSM 7213]
MSDYVCLDSSVLIKLLVLEEDSENAANLFEQIAANRQTVVLPDFAWAEVGTVLCKKVARKLLDSEQAEVLWEEFNRLELINYVGDRAIARTAWRIAKTENLPTLYDAAYLAVAEIVSRQSDEVCIFWTADERLVNSLSNRDNVKLLKEFTS